MEELTAAAAAELLDIRPAEISYLIRHGHLEGRKDDRGHWLITRTSVDARVCELAEWMSFAQVADLVGVATSTVGAAVTRGELASRRPGRGQVPSIPADAGRAWAAAHLEAQRARAAAREHRRAERTARTGPPAPVEGAEWLDSRAAATRIGLSSAAVTRLAKAERIPATRRGRFWWFRSDHLSMFVEARAFRSRARHCGDAT